MRRRIGNVLDWLRWRQAYRWSVRSWFIPGDLAASRLVLDSFRPSRVLKPEPTSAPSGRRVLVLAPHPDDESIGAGGTLLLARESGCEVSVLFITTGRARERDVRRKEAEDVCEAAGFKAHFAEQDADAIDVAAAADVVAGLLAEHRFDCVFVPFLLDDHDDHRRANEVLLEAAALPAGARGLPREVWAYHVYGPGPMNCIVDISAIAERKRGLVARHRSQMTSRDWAHFSLGMNAVLSRFLPGDPAARHAEGFMVAPAEEYLALVREALACGLYLDSAGGP
jgi:N-acetylglucosamine malate deacetylase 1